MELVVSSFFNNIKWSSYFVLKINEDIIDFFLFRMAGYVLFVHTSSTCKKLITEIIWICGF